MGKVSARPGLGEKIAFALGDGGCNFVWTTIGSFLTLYYTDNVGIAAATVGTMMLLSRLLDGISDLIMGTIIDRTHTKWGKARPWILWSAIPMMLGLIMVFTVPSGLSAKGKVAYAFISYVIMAAVIYTACNLAYNTLLALFSPEPKDRVQASSFRFFCTMAIVLFINYNTQNFVGKFGWTGMATIFGAIAVVMLLITFAFTRERNNESIAENKPAKAAAPEKKVSVGQSFKLLFKNKYFILLTIIFVVNYTALGVNNGLRIYFARDVLGNPALMGTLTLCFILPKMIGNLVYPYIVKALGNWRSMVIGYIIEIIGVAIMAFLPTSTTVAFAGLVLLGVGGIPHNAGLFAMVADVVDYGEWKTGVRLDGLTNSATSFGMKVGAGLGSAIVGWGLAWAAYDGKAKAQAAATVAGIKSAWSAGQRPALRS
ncbi:MAG: glycoside-pentoside-hexuronide (GPH):cation symporter [Porcincola intestinalis]|uniref:MFS transporter n=1 Tax=Porcincola intestinalis TaxID=2606632 RepID=UPI002A912FC8|nr:glycoside-pentoside-hexuronide (GPH):cation symporter [Porcincola intestinalis]MDY5331598.1 glycoside-pentoside-hexuronide (GPH):cation symporter [Porcincola intestinalis]